MDAAHDHALLYRTPPVHASGYTLLRLPNHFDFHEGFQDKEEAWRWQETVKLTRNCQAYNPLNCVQEPRGAMNLGARRKMHDPLLLEILPVRTCKHVGFDNVHGRHGGGGRQPGEHAGAEMRGGAIRHARRLHPPPLGAVVHRALH